MKGQEFPYVLILAAGQNSIRLSPPLVLTKEQAEYIDVDVEGPYKPAHYRY